MEYLDNQQSKNFVATFCLELTQNWGEWVDIDNSIGIINYSFAIKLMSSQCISTPAGSVSERIGKMDRTLTTV